MQCLPTPALTRVTPSSGPTNAATAVTITGQNFFSGPGLSAQLGSGSVGGLAFGSATTLTGTTPLRAGNPGQVSLVVTLPGNHAVTLNNAFRYYFGKVEFGSAASQSQGLFPRSVAIADFTGDGPRDVAMVSSGSNEVFLFKGNGNGVLAAPTKIAVGMSPVHAIVGDWNGDGKPDLAVANALSGNVSILLNNGSGGVNGSTIPVAATPEYLLRGDWDGDGKQDIAVMHYLNKTISILRGKGDGTFKNSVDSNGQTNGRQTARADFNGDGKQDLVVGADNGSPAVLIGDGNGGFGNPVVLTLAQSGCGGVTAGDFDGDNRADVVVVGTGGNTKITYFPGNGNGTFGAAVSTDIPGGTTDHRYAEALDLDRDGRLDLIVSSHNAGPGVIHVFRGKGGGQFDPIAALAVSSNPWGFALGDLNGDNKEDLVVAAHLSSKLDILLNTSQ